MPRSPLPHLALLPALLLAAPLASHAQEPPAPPAASPAPVDSHGAVERWYEVLRNGQKVGWQKVAWAPSTWQGRPTLHDTTTIVRRSVRNMSGIKDEFQYTVTIDLERSEDGTLWWERSVTVEAARTTVSELTWTGSGYSYVEKVQDRAEEQKLVVALDAPVMTDAEAFFGARVRAGGVAVGQETTLRLIDLVGRGVMEVPLRVVAREEVDDAGGRTACWKLVQRDPDSGAESVMWLDDQGAFVRIGDDAGNEYRRVDAAAAQEMPVRPAEYTVTSAASPTLERIFSADKLRVELHLRADALRGRVEFPESPWTHTIGVRGSEQEGWVYELELKAHDDPALDAPLASVEPEKFARELEHTVIHPCRDPRLVQTAREVIGEETSIRKAAWKLARFVYSSLQKESPDVSEATALEILEQRKGDCSEHATLFVALCRAAGIPARKCSGYVSLGSVWGGHAWAEIWAGGWLGADPTTGEVGTGARYVFYGYDDTKGSFPGVISSRVGGRMRLVGTQVEEDGQVFDLTDPTRHFLHEPERRRWLHVLCGIEAVGLPDGWKASMGGASSVLFQKEGFSASVNAYADQGATLEEVGGQNGTFAGHPALRYQSGERIVIMVHARRRLIRLAARGSAEDLATLEAALAPTFGPPPPAPAPASGGEVGEEHDPGLPPSGDATPEQGPR